MVNRVQVGFQTLLVPSVRYLFLDIWLPCNHVLQWLFLVGGGFFFLPDHSGSLISFQICFFHINSDYVIIWFIFVYLHIKSLFWFWFYITVSVYFFQSKGLVVSVQSGQMHALKGLRFELHSNPAWFDLIWVRGKSVVLSPPVFYPSCLCSTFSDYPLSTDEL